MDVIARSAKVAIPANLDVFEKQQKADQNGPIATRKDTMVKDPAMGNLLVGRFTGDANGLVRPAKPVSEIKLFLEDRALADVWLAVTWSSAPA